MDCLLTVYFPLSVCVAVLIGKRIKCRGSSKFFKTLHILPDPLVPLSRPHLSRSLSLKLKKNKFFYALLRWLYPFPAVRFVIVAPVCFVSQFTVLLLWVPASALSLSL